MMMFCSGYYFKRLQNLCHFTFLKKSKDLIVSTFNLVHLMLHTNPPSPLYTYPLTSVLCSPMSLLLPSCYLHSAAPCVEIYRVPPHGGGLPGTFGRGCPAPMWGSRRLKRGGGGHPRLLRLARSASASCACLLLEGSLHGTPAVAQPCPNSWTPASPMQAKPGKTK